MSDNTLRFQDVFVPGGFPSHTYNPRDALGLEAKLSGVKLNLCKLVTLTGNTKSGKTVLAQKVFPREEAIWIDGGAIRNERDFWRSVCYELGLSQTVELEDGMEVDTRTETSGGFGVDAIVARGELGTRSERGEREAESTRKTKTSSEKVLALKELKKRKTPIVIDDFHYLERNVQALIIRSLKPVIFGGVPAVIIAIPHRRYEVVKVEREMAGRTLQIRIPAWNHEELKFIPKRGFELLGYVLSTETSALLASESIGSPHLMQEFCRGICQRKDVFPSDDIRSIAIDENGLKEIFHEVAETIGRPIFEKLSRGPRARTDRKPRRLRNGRTVDIYQLVLLALASRRPGLDTMEYEEIRNAIREICESPTPQINEVARVLRMMAQIAASDESSSPVIDFEEAEKKLHITDPFFAFYLKWGDLN